jgi:hypothetical protein
MNTIQKISNFRSEIGTLLAKYFFFSQASLKQILIDYINTFIKNLKYKPFDTVYSQVEINEELPEPNNFRTDFSEIIYINDYVPKCIREIINANKKKIQEYLGVNFLYDKKINVYKTFNIPEFMHKFDIYANIWHIDNHDGFKLIRIFILLHEVKDSDGPLVYLDRESTKKYWHFLKDRWTYQNKNGIKEFIEQKKFTGKKGNYLLVNTAECAHRASVPTKERTMLVATLYPEWRIKDGRCYYKF